MDLHRLAEARSLAYHRAVAERLRRDPSLLDQARARVDGWLAGSTPFYAQRWREVLAGDANTVATVLTEDSERAAELRQSSPFAERAVNACELSAERLLPDDAVRKGSVTYR